VADKIEDPSIVDLRAAADTLKQAIASIRTLRVWPESSPPMLPTATGWNFETYDKYISQRFVDLSVNLRERYEAQQTGVNAALAAAEKAVNAALIAAEKAVDKAEGAQQLRNEAQNEFRKSLSDLSGLMWTQKEGTEKVESLRREVTLTYEGMETRVGNLEKMYSNIQGRIWALSAIFAIVALGVSIGIRFIGH
jgi:hypothetical protein